MKKVLYVMGISLILCGCIKTTTLKKEMPYDFKIDGLAYKVISEDRLSLTASTYPSSYVGLIRIPDYVDYDGVQYLVSEIGYQAFYESEISGVTIPNTLWEVQEYAFQYSSLKTLNVEDGTLPLEVTYGFEDCPIEQAYIGRSVSGIWNNRTLNFLTLGPQVKSFGINLNQPLMIFCKSETPPTINITGPEEVFKDSIIYVPASAVETYMTNTQWKQFSIILVDENNNRVEDWEEVNAGEYES